MCFTFLEPTFSKNAVVQEGRPLHIRNYTSAIYYVWAKLGKYMLKDVDILPLQGLSWQTDLVIYLLRI